MTLHDISHKVSIDSTGYLASPCYVSSLQTLASRSKKNVSINQSLQYCNSSKLLLSAHHGPKIESIMKHLQFASISLLNIPLWKRRFVGFLGFIFANCFGECTKSQYDSTKKDARSAKGNKNLHIQSMSYGRPTLPIFR